VKSTLTLLTPLTFGIAFFLGLECGGFQLVLIQVAEEFALDPVIMGGVVTSQFVAVFLGPLLFGWVSDRIGKKIVLAFGMAFFVVGCFGAFASSALLFFSCSVFILGLGFSTCESVGSSLLSDSFPGKESFHLNIMQCGFSLGAVLSPLIFSRLINAGLATWRIVFLCSGLGYVLIYPLLLLYRNGKAAKTGKGHLETGGSNLGNGDGNLEAGDGHLKTGAAPVREQSVFSPFFIVLFFSMTICVCIESGIGFFADSLFVTEFGNHDLGAYAISAFWFTMSVSRFTYSRLKIKPQTMVITGFLLIFIILVCLLPLRNPHVLLASFFLVGIASGPVWPMILGMGASLNQNRSGTNTSILYAAGGLGGLVIPLVIGFSARHFGFYRSFWLLAILAFTGFILMGLGSRKRYGSRERFGSKRI